MAPETHSILGMMSGTSLDGLDMALCEFRRTAAGWTYRIARTGFHDYDAEMRERLQGAITASAGALLEFHESYGHWLGMRAAAFLKQDKTPPRAIASHGHTIHHQPERGYTFQLGSPQQIALATGIRTVGDFRNLDIALGGQGAPLVPIGDQLLFGSYDFCLNLGGICNISFDREGVRQAFDIGIGNMLLNHLSQLLGHAYDPEGALARKGRLNAPLLRALDVLPYYEKPLPKSTGFEWFRDAVLPLLDKYPDHPQNQLHTAVHHIAGQIEKAIRGLSEEKSGHILATGGGALNTFLIETLANKLGKNVALELPETGLIHYKEALVFAFLGLLGLEGEINVLASVTGARLDSCSGVVYEP